MKKLSIQIPSHTNTYPFGAPIELKLLTDIKFALSVVNN